MHSGKRTILIVNNKLYETTTTKAYEVLREIKNKLAPKCYVIYAVEKFAPKKNANIIQTLNNTFATEKALNKAMREYKKEGYKVYAKGA